MQKILDKILTPNLTTDEKDDILQSSGIYFCDARMVQHMHINKCDMYINGTD